MKGLEAQRTAAELNAWAIRYGMVAMPEEIEAELVAMLRKTNSEVKAKNTAVAALAVWEEIAVGPRKPVPNIPVILTKRKPGLILQ